MSVIRIRPLSRFAASRSPSTFAVEVRGEESVRLNVRACDEAMGYGIGFENGSTEVSGAGEHVLTVKAPRGASMA